MAAQLVEMFLHLLKVVLRLREQGSGSKSAWLDGWSKCHKQIIINDQIVTEKDSSAQINLFFIDLLHL